MGNLIGYSLQSKNLFESDDTFSPSRNLEQLPMEIIMKIFGYLSCKDILNLRKVSKYLYNASKCAIFCDKIKFKVTKLSKKSFKNLEHMLKLRQSKIKLDIQDLPMAKVKYFIPYFTDVFDISVSLQHLEKVCRHCDNLNRLTVKLNVSVTQNYKDAFLCIRNLRNLNELILEGEYNRLRETRWNYENVLALKMLSISALNYSQGVVSKIGFRDVCWTVKLPNLRRRLETSCDEELWKSLRNANHINSWSFTFHYDTDKVIPLPESIIKLEIVRGSFIKFDLNRTKVNTLILNETNFDISRYDRRNYPDIQTLKLRKMYLRAFNYKRLSFPNLENLTIELPDSDLAGGLLFSDLDECNFLRRFKSTLKRLTLASVDKVNYTRLGWILNSFLSLKNLCFINVGGIPSEFLDTWKSRLNIIVIRR